MQLVFIKFFLFTESKKVFVVWGKKEININVTLGAILTLSLAMFLRLRFSVQNDAREIPTQMT